MIWKILTIFNLCICIYEIHRGNEIVDAINQLINAFQEAADKGKKGNDEETLHDHYQG